MAEDATIARPVGPVPRTDGSRMTSTGAVVLAAGRSERMGRAKPLVLLAGETLLERALRPVLASSIRETVVVVGFEAEAVGKLVPTGRARRVENAHYADGMSSSIKVGVAALSPDVAAFFLVLADAPFVQASTYDILASARDAAGARIAIPTFDGVRGNPILLDRRLAPEVEALVGDFGCRVIHQRHPTETIEVAVEDPGVLIDLDTPADVERAEFALASKESLESLAHDLGRESRSTPVGRAGPRPRVRGRFDAFALVPELERRREPFVLAVVVGVRAPTSGKPGFKAIVHADGHVSGWVGGSCSRHALLTEARAALEDGEPRILRLRAGSDPCPPAAAGVIDRVMECQSGGSMEIYLEPHGPPPQLLIVGDSPVAESLTAFGRLLGFRVVVAGLELDPARFPDADEVVTDLDQLPGKLDGSTFAVVATMAQYDARALELLAPSKAAYVGLVASRRRAGLLFDELRAHGVAPSAIERIQNPAGVEIDAKTPEEIALAVAAEITHRRRASVPQATPPPVALERDPVCGMDVEPGATPLHLEHRGRRFYFCSEGCLERFSAHPAEFVTG